LTVVKKVTGKTFVSNKNYQKYLSGLTKGKRPELNEEAIIEAERKDGYFGVVTNVKDMSASEIVSNYKNLWIIEDAFGEIKGNLKARPVFHWTDERIIGHLSVCFLAYFCEAHMTRMLREQKVMLSSDAIEDKTIDPRPLTIAEAMHDLSEVRAIPVGIGSRTLWVRTDITGNAARLFKALGIKIPSKLLDLKKLPVLAQTDPDSITP